MEIDAQVKDWGNSFGIRIPKTLARKAGITKGDHVRISFDRTMPTVDEMFGVFKGSAPFVREPDDPNRY